MVPDGEVVVSEVVPPGNLPAQVSSFVGREGDIAQGTRLLDGARLVTFTGTGGCGKTRLAQQVAMSRRGCLALGTWWVELAPVTDAALVAEAVASAIGLRLSAERPAVDLVGAHLAEHPALVVLDNCEHVLGGVATLVHHLLRTSSGSTVLTTSREPLGIEGEVTWRVPSLEQSDAVHLFEDRAMQARPNFRFDDTHASVVEQICRRLDGIPLAIELAAARTRSLPLDRIAAELDDRFRLLAGGNRAALPRHQTLVASVDWSHDLLDELERALLRRIATFAGSFTLDAAEQVGAGSPLDRYDVLDVLGRLVDKSLVQADDDGAGSLRYRLLETIRQYGFDRLVEAGEQEVARDAHLVWVAGLVSRHEDAATNTDPGAIAALEGALPEIRSALGWAFEGGRTDAALELIGSLGVFWAGCGHYGDARSTVPVVLEAPGGSPELRARARWAGAYVRFYANDVPGALEWATEALEEAGDDRTRARCLHTIGTALMPVDPPEALEVCARSVALASAAGDGWCQADALQMQGFAQLSLGRIDLARSLLDDALALARRAGNRFQEAWHLVATGHIAELEGDPATADRLAPAALALARELGDPALEAYCLSARGRYLGSHGRFEELAELVAEVEGSSKEWGLLGSATLPAIMAQASAVDDPAGAAETLAALARAVAESGVLMEAVPMWGLAAFASLDADDLDSAAAHARSAIEHESFRVGVAFARVALATADRRGRGVDAAEAELLGHEALVTFVELEIGGYAPLALELLGGCAVDAGSHVEAVRLLAAADTAFTAVGHRRSPTSARWFAADVARCQTALGESFAEHWAEGVGLDWREAATYVRRARGARKRPPLGWAALTPTEAAVADLVADGLSNPEIATKLLMGRATVKTHLSRCFTKLQVANRAELAAKVATRRMSPGASARRPG